jgi:hypothetical protein
MGRCRHRVGLLCATKPVQAGLELQLSATNAPTYTSPESSIGFVNETAFNFRSFTVVSAQGIGSPMQGNLSLPSLDTSTLDVHSGAAGTLTIMLSRSGNNAMIPVVIATSLTGITSGAPIVTAQTFLDAGNRYFEISGPGVTPSTSLPVGSMSTNAYAILRT